MDRKRKLALITHEFYSILSGGTIYADKICSELSKIGYDIEIITTSVAEAGPGLEVMEHFKVRRIFTGRTSKQDARFYEHLSFLILGFPQILYYVWRGNFSLIVPFFALPSGLIGWLISLILSIPTVLFVDAADTPGFASAQNTMVNRLAFLFRFITKHSSGNLLVDGIQDIARSQIDNPLVAIIPPATIIPKVQAKPGTHGDVVQFLSIGRIVPRKGFDLIIKAAALVAQSRTDFHITIVGYGSMEVEISHLICDLSIQDFITLAGRVEYSDLIEQYLGADCYIFYGAREGSSVAMMEALAYGLPMLASDQQENVLFVETARNGYLVPHPDPMILSKFIIKVLEQKDKLPSMGLRSREIAEKYSWPNAAKLYDSFFEEVLTTFSAKRQAQNFSDFSGGH